MDSSFPTLPNSTSKREQIIKLLSEGNHSTKNIARIVGTTEAYVWKEKSKNNRPFNKARHRSNI
jgi:DNA-binding CsgD family transcriptional regulator